LNPRALMGEITLEGSLYSLIRAKDLPFFRIGAKVLLFPDLCNPKRNN